MHFSRPVLLSRLCDWLWGYLLEWEEVAPHTGDQWGWFIATQAAISSLLTWQQMCFFFCWAPLTTLPPAAPSPARALQLSFLLCCSALLLVQWRESSITSSSPRRTLHWVPSAQSLPAFHKCVHVFVCECVCVCICVHMCSCVCMDAHLHAGRYYWLIIRCVYMSICETTCLQQCVIFSRLKSTMVSPCQSVFGCLMSGSAN